MTVSVIESVGLVSTFVVLSACSGGGNETSDRGDETTSRANEPSEQGQNGRAKWSVTGTYEPDFVPMNPGVVVWKAQVQGEFHDPLVKEGVPTWSTSGTLTAMRAPSRQPTADECTSAVVPDQQVITLDDVNTRVVLSLSDDEAFYWGQVSTKISYERSSICPDGSTMVIGITDEISWLEISRTPRELEDPVLDGMETINAAKHTWTLTKLE